MKETNKPLFDTTAAVTTTKLNTLTALNRMNVNGMGTVTNSMKKKSFYD